MQQWKKIEDQSGIDDLMSHMGGFHDSCLVSAQFRTGRYVDETGAMALSFKPETYELTLEIHNQWTKRPLEMRFSGVRRVNLAGYSEQGDGIIYDAYLAFHDDVPGEEGKRLIVWADWDGFTPTEPDDGYTTYVCAENMSWREPDS